MLRILKVDVATGASGSMYAQLERFTRDETCYSNGLPVLAIYLLTLCFPFYFQSVEAWKTA
jgi:hypothetical protein